jgi:hypothetical protein
MTNPTPNTTTQAWDALSRALDELKLIHNWVVWRQPVKVPLQARNPDLNAASNNPQTWNSYAVACAVARTRADIDGIGFVLTETKFAAFDIDDCRNPETGELEPWTQRLVTRANSYTEITPSRKGIRIIGYGYGDDHHLPFKRPVPGTKVTCEIYRKASRYITITGWPIEDRPLRNIDAVIDEVASELERPTNSAIPPEAGQQAHFDDTDKLWETIKTNKGYEADRSRGVWYVICEMLRRGYPERDILRVILNHDYAISAHVYDQHNPNDYAKDEVNKASNKFLSPPTKTGKYTKLKATSVLL